MYDSIDSEVLSTEVNSLRASGGKSVTGSIGKSHPNSKPNSQQERLETIPEDRRTPRESNVRSVADPVAMGKQQDRATKMGKRPLTDQQPDQHSQEHAPPMPLVTTQSWLIARDVRRQAERIAERSQQVPAEATSEDRRRLRAVSSAPLLNDPISSSILRALVNNKVKLPLTDRPSQVHAPPGKSLDSRMEFYSTFRRPLERLFAVQMAMASA